MSSKGIKQLKSIQKDFEQTGDIKRLINSVNTLPPEMQELFQKMCKSVENEQ
jgi:hypothetical protein